MIEYNELMFSGDNTKRFKMKYVHVIFDTKAYFNEPIIRGIFTSYKRANEALEKLNDSVMIVNDIFNKQIRFVIKIITLNELK